MSTNCLDVRREIDNAASSELLSGPVRLHMNGCAKCAAFGDERQKLRDMVRSLGSVEAPPDFDFKLRARIAASNNTRRNFFSGNDFGVRSVAFASLILLFALVVILMNARLRTNESLPVATANPPATQTNIPSGPATGNSPSPVAANAGVDLAVATPAADDSQRGEPARARNAGNQPTQVSLSRNGRVKATDLSASPARVLRPAETAMGSSVFPLNASYQSLKVSVDDGRGTSRTISLPTVSFGSSHALARNPAPLMASTRDSW